MRCVAGEGISTASTVRTFVGVAFRDELTEVIPELSGGASCCPSMAYICLLGDLRVGVEFPDSSCSSSGVSSRNLLGEAEMSLRGRPRPRFTILMPFWCFLSGDTGACRFVGENVLSRVFARDELEEATTISSSSSWHGMRFFRDRKRFEEVSDDLGFVCHGFAPSSILVVVAMSGLEVELRLRG